MRLLLIFLLNFAKSEDGTCTKDSCPDEKPKKPKMKKGALPFDPDKIKVCYQPILFILIYIKGFDEHDFLPIFYCFNSYRY